MEKFPVQRISILGVPIDCVLEENIDTVLEALCEQEKNQRIVFIDMPLLLRARKNTEWMNFISDAALVLPANNTITKAINFLYAKQSRAYFRLDIILQLMTILERKAGTAYLLGAHPNILQTADLNLRGTFRGLRFVGRHAGYYSKKNEPIIFAAIRKASPSLLVASRGLKGREMWMYQHGQNLNVNVLVYSPDCFDIFANKKSRPSVDNASTSLDIFSYLLKPWRILGVFRYLGFQIALLAQRIKMRRNH